MDKRESHVPEWTEAQWSIYDQATEYFHMASMAMLSIDGGPKLVNRHLPQIADRLYHMGRFLDILAHARAWASGRKG